MKLPTRLLQVALAVALLAFIAMPALAHHRSFGNQDAEFEIVGTVIKQVTMPRVIHRVEIQYPQLARQARIQGDVVLSATIDSHGNVVHVTAISGPSELLYPAAMTFREWEFEPTYLNGKAWPVQFEVTLHFRLS
jgi:protein TonB